MKVAKNITDDLVPIAKAVEGVKYFCVDCNAKMIAKNKKKERKRDAHFAHSSDCPCTGNLETYLHKISKIIIDKERKILLPRLGNIQIINTSIEKQFGPIRPDIFITDQNNCGIIIEIFVEHKTEEDKIEKIKEMNVAAFEIDLSSLSRDSELEMIKYQVIENLKNKAELESSIQIHNINSPIEIKEREIHVDTNQNKTNYWRILIPIVAFLAWIFWPRKKKYKQRFWRR